MKVPGTTKMVPPDGGWGWIVVIGSSLINLATRSIEPSFGLLFGDLLKELGVATTGAAIIMSTLDAMINFSGLFVGPLIKKYSYRKVGILGAVLSGLALMATSRANSIAHILATYSIVGGLGFGLATASTFVALNSYFSERRGQAVGLAMAGTALGFMMMPQAVSVLLELYQFRGAVFILGAMSLNAIVGASLLQPVKWHMKPAPPTQLIIKEDTSQELKPVAETGEDEVSSSLLSVGPRKPSCVLPVRKASTFNSVQNIARKRKTSVISNVSHLDLSSSTMYIQYDSDSDNEDGKNQSNGVINNNKAKSITQKGCWARFSDMMDFDLLKDPIYLNILFGLSITYVAELNFKMVVPFFMANLGYSKRETALALSLMAMADIAARVIVPPIYDRLHYSRRSTLLAGCTCVAIARSCLAQQTEWTPLIICLVVHGFFRGLTLINFPLVISEYATVDTFAAAFGLSMVSKGCFIVALGPFVGLIRDLTDSYPICIHTQSLMILTCVLAWSAEFLILRRTHLQCKNDLT